MPETSTTAGDQQPAPTPPTSAPLTPQQHRRERRGLTALVAMVVVILLFTAVSIVIEVVSNAGTRYRAEVELGPRIRNDAVEVTFHVRNTGTSPGRPDVCEATLMDLRGARVGTARIRLREPIPPGETFSGTAVGTVASAPVNGTVHCRALSPG